MSVSPAQMILVHHSFQAGGYCSLLANGGSVFVYVLREKGYS